MKKLSFFIIAFSFFIAHVFSQSIDSIFKSMPQQVTPGIADEEKVMLLASSDSSRTMYALGEINRLLKTDDYLMFRTSDAGTTQIKLLPLINGTKIVCVIKTACSPACDSSISFYTTEWKRLDATSLLPSFDMYDFLKEDLKNQNEASSVNLPDILPVYAQFENGNDNLVCYLDFEHYLTKKQNDAIEKLLRHKSITMKWNKSSFILK